MNKTQFSKQFDTQFKKIHRKLGTLVDTQNPAIMTALIAVCSDALVYCTYKLCGGNLDLTAELVSKTVNKSLETTREADAAGTLK